MIILKRDFSSETLRKDTMSVSTTNSMAERNFGMLDRLIREKPNANMITYESIIMNATNKTSVWKDSLSAEKSQSVMKWERESVRSQVWRLKDENKTRSEVSSKISEIGGLWLEEDQVEVKLNGLGSEKEKIDALKCQLQFRQKILSGVT